MRRPDRDHRRRFTLLDSIVLVALCALGIQAHRWFAAIIARANVPTGPVAAGTVILDIRRRGFLTIPVHVSYWFEIAIPWLLTIAFGLLIYRLIPPRPRGSRLARQPGFLAIAMAVGSVLLVWACWLVLIVPLQMAAKLAFWSNWDYSHVFFGVTIAAMMVAGAGVAVSWALTLILRRPRAGGDWIERAGIALGLILIVCLPFYLWDSLLYF